MGVAEPQTLKLSQPTYSSIDNIKIQIANEPQNVRNLSIVSLDNELEHVTLSVTYYH